MIKANKITIKILSLAIALCLALAVFNSPIESAAQNSVKPVVSGISRLDTSLKTNQEDYYDSNAIYKLPETLSSSDDVSIIVAMNSKTVTQAYMQSGTDKTISQYTTTYEARSVAHETEKERQWLLNLLYGSGVRFALGESYDTILSGFEITIKAKDFEKVNSLLSGKATLIVGETYEPAVTDIVHNDVDVYETGIFDSSNSDYQGDGVVVAVLDTGLDYTHSAFSLSNFTTATESFTLQSVAQKINKTAAAAFTSGLVAEDVYINRKVPFAYDYADKDPDVLPINSNHGTHVAGVIAGKDETITGVAPNAQLAIMKVFSDTTEGAKTSWILSALEDCVTLGVDVINMSLGSACGFTREVDEIRLSTVYDSIRDAGISLIVSAANSYNATMGSEKNGNNGLTSNPDSGTVGAPSTYEASLSVASVDGVKTPYLMYKDDIIYFTEASTSDTQTKNFVNDVLLTVGAVVTSHDFEYVAIPGIGRSSDYMHDASYYHGKIVLVKRGTSSFEDKVRVAIHDKGAAGIIIYNNVSGTISMSVGADMGAVCSISQDEGERLAAAGSGIIRINKNYLAGPFMSNFSSWGPTSDLKIKPEITAHGGEILSAVPGQGYERLSGTSMAAPNQAGATALIRQYVKYSGIFGQNLTTSEITSYVNQLMMSTADIVYNKNGLPYAVRKQGAGLVNINKAATSASYITTYDKNGAAMDKTKLELGDDKSKSGVYEMTFDINNISNVQASYNIDAVLLTEGVSSTYTGHGGTTVTQDGRLLAGTTTTVVSVTGGNRSGNKVTVDAKNSATVTVKIVLSEEDKQYINNSFKYGMYVEGFITLKAAGGTQVDMNIPMLAFFGDWTKAPIFDEEYYDTHADEINAGLDFEDKLMADAYATRVVGGLYSDYIAVLGQYYFVQDPSATQIAANKDYIAISNQQGTSSSTINSIRYIWAGLLRNAKEVQISVVEDSTGREIFNRASYNQRKSYSYGSGIVYSSIDMEFDALERDLKNNTKYTVIVTTYIDYGAYDEQQNVRNTFEFPLYIDFEAPIVTSVEYRTEYDRTSKKTHLYADINIYDNHYAMGMQVGQIVPADPSSGYSFAIKTFGKYITPVYSAFNSTSKVTIELTEQVERIKQSAGIVFNEDGSYNIVNNNNSFIVTCYDYAMNTATYEISLPDEVMYMHFNEDTIRLSPNETLDLTTALSIYPFESWAQVLDFSSSNSEIADVINQTLIAKQSGEAVITATGYDALGNSVTASVQITVLAQGDEGYKGSYTVPEVNKFSVTGYTTNKAYYSVSSQGRDIGVTGGSYEFGKTLSLSMFPSESVTLDYIFDSYFPSRTGVMYRSSNSRIATVSDEGEIIAQSKGNTIITVNVTFDGKQTLYSGNISVEVKDPFITSGSYLTGYKGLGGTVVIPTDRGITSIQSYAFSNYEYVDKDLSAGDVIDKESPYLIKPAPIGEDTITKIIIPEGVTEIKSYAFAKLSSLEEVVLPSTVNQIDVGAFSDCVKLSKINLEKVQFINERAFSNCNLQKVSLDSAVAIGNFAFENGKLNYIELPKTAQSLGIGAFYANKYMTSVQFDAPRVKIGTYAFAECSLLTSVNINAAVIPSYAFYNAAKLKDVTLGQDVAVINDFAFAGTAVTAFKIDSKNNALSLREGGALVYSGTKLLIAAPGYSGTSNNVTLNNTTEIATGAFAGNVKILRVFADGVTTVGAYAFADCTNLQQVSLNSVTQIGDYAFWRTAIAATPSFANITHIGDYAFALTEIASVTLPNNSDIGNYAFAYNIKLASVTIGDNVTVGNAAFYCPVQLFTYDQTGNFNNYSTYTYEVRDENGAVVQTYSHRKYNFNAGVVSQLTALNIGKNVQLGRYAFAGNAKLSTVVLGDGAEIGDYAFYNVAGLTSIDLSKAVSIGDYAFSGARTQDFWLSENVWNYAYQRKIVDGEIVAYDFAYTSFAPAFAAITLTEVNSIGEAAFANNTALTTVVWGARLQEVGAYAFANCTSLSQAALPTNVIAVGDYAFYGTALTEIDLGSVETIGEYAFARTQLTEVTLKSGADIADGAFAYCDKLTAVYNLDKTNTIGAYAFSSTALTHLVLTQVAHIGDYAFSMSKVTSVDLGETLKTLGENPFYGCDIATFGKESDIIFSGNVVGTQLLQSYDVSATVKVIDGVLYQVVPKGLELVSYPIAKDAVRFTVQEGTVRISARAFAGAAALQNITLPSTLKALGDKAFFDCQSLAVVVFKGYAAPILEEAMDKSYMSANNLPYGGYNGQGKGLGITDFYMWNASSNQNNFYYGANFVNYIGHISREIVLVRPANGQNYDTFIFGQYFGTTVNGSNAATDATKAVIEQIENLNKSITLNDEAAVIAARSAYNSIPSVEQQALVTNYSLLRNAESTIEYLKARQGGGGDVTPEPPVEQPGLSTLAYIGIAAGGLAILGAAGYVLFVRLRNKKSAV